MDVTTAPEARSGETTKRQIEAALCRVGVYRPARNVYQRVFNRSFYRTRVEARDFFRQFIEPGDLVFDIGANEGRMTEMFLELGARVIAAEPNPELAELVSARYRTAAVTVEQTAVGAERGTAELQLGVHNGHSTLSTDWRDSMAAEEAAERWNGAVEVQVLTLDALIARHGVPAFVKIDVEGFEPQVLAGLNDPVPCLSFEFLCGAIEIAEQCLWELARLGTWEFNHAFGEGAELRSATWLDAESLLQELRAFAAADPESYGDVYARHVGA